MVCLPMFIHIIFFNVYPFSVTLCPDATYFVISLGLTPDVNLILVKIWPDFKGRVRTSPEIVFTSPENFCTSPEKSCTSPWESFNDRLESDIFLVA
jgi:hypothetical protein